MQNTDYTFTNAMGYQYPLRKEPVYDPRGITLDIIDDYGEDRESLAGSIIVPRKVILNGQPILLPEDAKITMCAQGKDVVNVTLTMMARSVRVGRADDFIEFPFGELETKTETS